MVNSKYYKLVGWGLTASSLYFLWQFFLAVGIILFNLVTNGSLWFDGRNIWEIGNYAWIELFIIRMPFGTALLGGGILVLMRPRKKA